MAEGVLDKYQNNLFSKLPGDNKGLELVYKTGKLEEKGKEENYLQKIEDATSLTRPTIRDTYIEESELLEKESSGNRTYVYLTEDGKRVYESSKNLFESKKLERVKEKAEELKEFLLRWPTADELEVLTDTEIDRSVKSHLANNIGWSEPDEEKIQEKRKKVFDLINESIALMEDLPRGLNLNRTERDLDPVMKAEIKRYKSDNFEKLKKIEFKEGIPPEYPSGGSKDKLLKLTPEMQFLLDTETLYQQVV